ncbi:hypothetical protein MD484_g6809, partial [Candolleomyces efflorescens]
MDNSPPENGGVFPNAHDLHIDELNNYIVHGNQYIQVLASDQATLIRALNPILDASHTRDLATCPPNSACLPDTRVDVIKVLVEWADSILLWNTHILWLHGFVGCGKSALALAIALKFERRNRLVGSFFFFRKTGDRCKMIRFAATLAFQLAVAIPEAAPFIHKAIRDGGLQVTSLVARLRRLVYEPFKAAVKRIGTFKAFLKPFLIVVDGLDECEDHQEVRAFIDDLLLFFKKNPFIPLRFLITSRVEQHIRGQLKKGHVRLLDLVNRCSRKDLEVFMEKCFEEEKEKNPVIEAYIRDHGDWPTKEDKATLVDHIDGSFIFASVLFKYIVDPTDTSSTPMERLPHTLNMNPGLDILYSSTLSRSQDIPHFHEVISTLALGFEPFSIAGIAGLLGIETFEVVRVLVDLQAIIHIPGTDDLPVTICHTSLRDFLTTESRSGRFFTSPGFHLHLSHRCNVVRASEQSQAGSAVALYSGKHQAGHFAKFLSLPLPTQDDMYARILSRSQDIPHFHEVLSTLALAFEPLSIVGIADLLGITTLEVVRVLINLQAIIHIPGTDDSPVTICHTSLRDFLTTESRSGRFFTSPVWHVYLSHRCSIVRDSEQWQAGSAVALYSGKHQAGHFANFLSIPLPTQDDLYARILSRSQDIPHFHEVISILAFAFEPLSIVGIADLLGITTLGVVRVLINLQAIIHIPLAGTDDLPVTICHTSLPGDFLTTESRSKTFFTSPVFHRDLSHRCSIVRDSERWQAGSAVTLYSGKHQAGHFANFLSIPLPTQDDLYARILSRSQDIPHFHEVISTLALAFEPLSIVGIADLLGITTLEVVRVLINLQAIIHIPGTDDSPVTICHTSLRDFLTTESRSGHFFTSPHFHLHLSLRCSIPRPEQRPDGAVALYSSVHCADHFIKFISLPPATQELSPHRPPGLDGIYTHILAKSESLPYISDIIATIVMKLTPLSVDEMSALLSIDSLGLTAVLVNLQTMITIPQAANAPITVRSLDVRQFLTDESRSGRFFVSPSSHFKLSYYHFNLRLGHYGEYSYDLYSKRQCGLSHSHWLQLGAIPERELKRLILDLPSHTSLFSRYLFSFTRCFLRVFEDNTGHDSAAPEEILDMLVECASSLASSMEQCSTAADLSVLLKWNFHQIKESIMKRACRAPIRIRQEQVVAMQGNIRRADKAFRAKVCQLELVQQH